MFVCQICGEPYVEEEAKRRGLICCGVLLTPIRRRKNFYTKELGKEEVESESRIGMGKWTVSRVKVRVGAKEKTIWTCDCPVFIRKGHCKHITKLQSSTQQSQTDQSQTDMSEEEAEADAVLRRILED